MTSQKTFKRRVRARAAKTGESFTTARAQLIARTERNGHDAAPTAQEPPEAAPASPSVEMPVSDAALVKATGHGWDHWLGLLDAWGAERRSHPEIARYVHEELGVPNWWSQGVTVGFERARGLRGLYQRMGGGGFSVNASFTVNVPIERVSQSFLDESERARWLPAGIAKPKTLRTNKGGSFEFAEPPSRVTAWMLSKGPSKTQAGVEHSRLPSAEAVEDMRAFWRARFKALKELLEG